MRTFGKGLVVAATVATALCAAGLVQARSERPGRALDVAPLTVTLAPASASNLIGTQHTVTATVTDSSAAPVAGASVTFTGTRSEEHTSELQSRGHLAGPLFLQKNKHQSSP